MKLILLLVLFSSTALKDTYSGPLTDMLSGQVPESCELKKETKFRNRKFIIRHLLDCQGKRSYIYIDNHKVRTMSEILMIQLADNRVEQVKALHFYEPPEYKPKEQWLSLLKGRPVEKVKFGEDLDAVTGATLTYHAVVDNVAKVMKIHQSLKDGSQE